nr:immunoglobulin heavy chain junction region [Mus musculus]
CTRGGHDYAWYFDVW